MTELTADVAPDCGLEPEFLDAAAALLNERRLDAYAHVEYPGVLCFCSHGREWATGLTGLHVCDADGDGDPFAGDDEPLVALERAGTLSVRRYVEALLAVIV